jgi:Tol biopolymer transport system component
MKITRLTSTGKARYAAISPDGRYVVHVVDEDGQQSLWMRQVAPSSNVQIVPPANFSYGGLSFSPDGNYIYYLVAELDYAVLYQRPMLGGAARKLIVDIDSGITFSPDNKQFAFLRGNPGKREVALMLANADGTAERALTVRKHPDSFPDFGAAPAWSADGTIIITPAGSADAGGPYMMLVEVSVADGAVKQITSGRWSEVGQIVWLRDGSGLVFSAKEQPSSPSQLWHISYPSGEAHRITNDLNDYLGVSLTANSTALVTVQSERSSNIWVAPDQEPSRASQITFSNLDGRGRITWTPDDKIVYASLTSGNSDLWIMDADGSNQKQLTVDARDNRSPAVSPDGRYIVFISDRSGSAHIWKMEIDGSNPEQLTNGVGEEWPTCTPDGKWVIYASGLDWTLWKVPIGGGGHEQVTHSYLGVIPRISPDGKLVAADDNGIVKVYPFEGGGPIKVFNNLFRFSWAPSGRALEYIDQSRSNINSQALDGGPPKQLTNFKSGVIGGFARSRDGKKLALSRGTLTNDVVLISDFRAQQ